MAAARLHEAADLGLATADVYCALLHYCGIGASPSLPCAIDHVARYLVAEPSGPFASVARDLAVGSLGVENARRLLFDSGARPTPGWRAWMKRLPRGAMAADIGARVAAFLAHGSHP